MFVFVDTDGLCEFAQLSCEGVCSGLLPRASPPDCRSDFPLRHAIKHTLSDAMNAPGATARSTHGVPSRRLSHALWKPSQLTSPSPAAAASASYGPSN